MVAAACLLLLLVQSAFAASFDEQRAAMSGTVATQPESAILALLQAGLAEGKAVPAIAEARQWLAQNRPDQALLFYHAARAAELSGDWKGAVSLYQQYLAAADLKSETADAAVFAAYTLQIERLGDSAGAYAFSKNDGHRLLVCPRARQFDPWFLDEAVRRNDVDAVAGRLLACIKNGVPDDLLVARYDHYFRWLVSRFETALKQAPRLDEDLLNTCQALVGAIAFNDELRLRLDWAVSVLHYNRAKLAGETVDPPLAEAKGLLTPYPQYAQHVQEGWLGGSRSLRPGSVDDLSVFWPHAVDAKMTVVIESISKMTALQKATFFDSWQSDYYSDTHGNRFDPTIGDVKAVRSYLDANPDVVNSRTGPFLPAKSWRNMSPEEAQALAPLVKNNTHPDASAIRAIAVGGKDLDAVIQALLAAERWRFTSASQYGSYTDSLWHYCGKPGGSAKRDEWIAKVKSEFEKAVAGDPDAKAPAAKRVAAFKALWSDYRSDAPKEPNGYNRARRILLFSPELVPELLQDDRAESQRLLRSVLAEGMRNGDGLLERDAGAKGLNPNQYAPWIQRLADRKTRGDLAELKKKHPELYEPHPLELDFSKAIVAGLKQGKLPDWLVMVWINLQHPDRDKKQVKLMQALLASPVWQTLSFEVHVAAREWFGKAAMTDEQAAWVEAADPALASKALRELPETADVATTVAALDTAISGARQSPVRFQIQGMDSLGHISMEVFKDPSVVQRVLDVLDGQRYRSMDETQPFGNRLYTMLKGQAFDSISLQRMAGYIAHYGARGSRGGKFRELVPLIESMLDSEPAAASALAQNAVAAFGLAPNIYGFEPSKQVPVLKPLAAKSAMRLGLMTIPVPKTHPAYPVYESQMEWMSGNEDSAWRLCQEHWEALLPIHRELSVDYLMWVLQRTIYSRDEGRQEALIKTLQVWANEEKTTLSRERRVEIELAYGDIAVQKGMLKQAHEIFKRTAETKAYDGLLIKYEATLRQARVERMAKDFDGALNTLNALAMEKVPEIWSLVRYAMAEVYYDMEEFDDANDQINAILNREADHADATIMQGRLQLKRKKLMEATEVELGTVSSQQTLVPGEKLKVTLSDPTLAVSGAGTEVEVVVWATSGDRERFFLRQFGDQKTKFRGEVATALGAPAPDDRVLQVIGDDEIYYAYSERFREKMNNMAEKRGGPITVASDALLMASGRRLLSEAEQRVADMEAQMEALKASAAAIRARQASAAGEQLLTGETDAAEDGETPVETRLKPGNPVHVRVIDPDRSRTAQIDELTVSVSTSSGDSIGRVLLTETGTHTGWFEGRIPTAGAQAMAYAQNSEPGRNPNMVISPKTSYPAWRPVPVSGRVPEFSIDLNDSVPLGQMTITANEPGSKLKTFVLQTGMNDRHISTVALYPKSMVLPDKPWHPSVTIMNDTDHHHGRNERSVYDLQEIQFHLERGWMSQQYAAGVAENVSGPSVAMTNGIPSKVAWKRQDRHHNAHVIYRFQGYFYESQEVTRRFKVGLGKWDPPDVHPSVADPAQYMLAVDGRVISERRETPPKAGAPVVLEGEISLRKGLHRFEIWSTGWDCRIGFGRSVQVFANLGADALQMVACPDAFFDPDRFPEGVLPHRNPPASITANANGTEFTVQFAPDSRARLLKLVFIDQEGPVPVVNKMTLQKPDGASVLPVKHDFAELNKNDTLEILTGDKVAVRYVDDRFVTKSKQNHERFLDVMFSNARLAFEFFEMRQDHDGKDVPYYERQLRFAHGQPVLLTIVDPDMDVSPELDTVTVTVEASGGGKQSFTATEDKDEPGTFRVWIKPVTGASAAPDEIQVGEGGTLTAIYRDAENTDPGIPVDRRAMIQHAVFTPPSLRMSHSVVTPIDFKSLAYPLKPVVLNPGFEPRGRVDADEEAPLGLEGRTFKSIPTAAGTILPRWRIANQMQNAASPPENGFAAVHGQMMYFEVEAAHLALRMGSVADVFVQTDAGRAAAGVGGGGPPSASATFDITVPGTMKLTAYMAILPRVPFDWRATPQIPIYIGGDGLASPNARSGDEKQESARFLCSVPLIAGALPAEGVLDLSAKEQSDLGIAKKHGLVVRPDEWVHVGFRYTDPAGNEQWLTGKARVITHPVFDVLEADQRTAKSEAYVGEELHLRVVDLGGDRTDGSDTVRVLMQAKSGAKLAVDLLEVDTHSGIFKATVPLTYAGRAALPDGYDAVRDGFPVVYGDMMGCLYSDAAGQKPPPLPITINKGADGDITPFSKQYDDPEIAMQTQFALAEAYLEMAKSHRARGAEDVAAREYDQARRLLAAVVDQFREAETRAHAEYLLGNLTQEEADATEAGDLQLERYRAALARFMNVTGTYPDTEHASKAQFKIATVYEKLDEPDIAAQEYVKLAYKYPQSEFLALSMARLGTHFLRKASGYEQQAAALLEQTENKDAQFEGGAMQKMAVKEYLNAGSIFARLLRRFPSHELAGQGGLRAGQAYMRAAATRQAVQLFLSVVDNESYDGPDVRAQAMYWAGMCYETLREPMAAYAIYKRLTYDFPESKWASYARGQLSQDRMLTLDSDLEMKRLEEQQ